MPCGRTVVLVVEYGVWRTRSVGPRDGSVADVASTVGDLIISVYVSQPVSAVIVPTKRLIGCTRVSLDLFASRQLTVSVSSSALAMVPGDVGGQGPFHRRALSVRLGDGYRERFGDVVGVGVGVEHHHGSQFRDKAVTVGRTIPRHCDRDQA